MDQDQRRAGLGLTQTVDQLVQVVHEPPAVEGGHHRVLEFPFQRMFQFFLGMGQLMAQRFDLRRHALKGMLRLGRQAVHGQQTRNVDRRLRMAVRGLIVLVFVFLAATMAGAAAVATAGSDRLDGGRLVYVHDHVSL